MKLKRLFAILSSVLLVAGCTFGIFLCGGIEVNNDASAFAYLSFDQHSGTVKKATQDVTGKISIKSEKVNVTYKVYSEIDRGKLSFEGNASVKGYAFTIDNLKLKPKGNTIIVTAATQDGKKETQTLNINYDSSYIKNSTVKNVKKVNNDGKLQYINNNLLVYFKENVSDAKRQEIINSVDGKCVGYVNGINMWQVEVKPTSFNNLEKMAKQLTDLDDVLYASYNLAQAATPTATIPNDPWNYDQNKNWSELNPEGANWSIEAVQALSAWDYQSYFSHINVGIVDAGIQDKHDDLAGKIFFPDDASAAENDPTDYHGTHVAGIMGAIPNNTKGVTGILWDTNMYCVNWNVLVGSDANIFAGLTETVEAGAKVVNFSLGLGENIESSCDPSVNPYVISYARQSEAVMTPLLNAGYDFIVVESAGNGHSGKSQDAIYNGYFCSVTNDNLLGNADMKAKINDRIIVVGSAQRVSQLSFMQAETSNAGSQVDICAPGVDVYSCYAGNTYSKLSGTSMASPMVAAIAALTWSVNPALTGAQVRNIVLSNTGYTVADNPSSNHPLTNSYKMVNAKHSVEAAIATLPTKNSINGANTGASVNNTTASPGDIITFGTYPQTKVTDESLIQKLNACTTDSNDTVTYGTSKYKKVSFSQYTPYYTFGTADAANSYQDDNGYTLNTVYWFKYEPIQWRVLSNTGGELYVMADKIIDAQAYNQTKSDAITWESSTLRSWLNNDFYNMAFSPDDKSKILANNVVNDDNPLLGTEGGSNTTDNLFLLSMSDSINAAYGFNTSYYTYDTARQTKGTDYAKSKGLYVYASNSYTGNSYWWLRSPGAANVNNPNSISFNSGSGGGCDDANLCATLGVRPALKLNLSSVILTTIANSGCVADSNTMLIYGLKTGITKAQLESNYVQIIGNGHLALTPASGVIGTGTKVELVNDLTSRVVATYYLVIFGDINGDGCADGKDAAMTNLIAAGMLSKSDVGNAAYLAADANHDGAVDTLDSELLTSSGLMLSTINQNP